MLEVGGEGGMGDEETMMPAHQGYLDVVGIDLCIVALGGK